MEYINKDFLLENETAKKLYHKYCEELPIIDYHCHLNPMEIAENKKFRNITELWLGGDHYKWRLIRACGVPENATPPTGRSFIISQKLWRESSAIRFISGRTLS